MFLVAILLSLSLRAGLAHSFCGFYIAKADTQLFNKASQVVIVRDADKTVLTMASDFKGEPKDFAVVIPVPTFIQKDQIHIGDKKIIDHLDAYTSPRLVEYFDDNPCRPLVMFEGGMSGVAGSLRARSDSAAQAKSLGVTIEAQYTVGEYDIIILSARQSNGLETWLKQNGYRIPNGAVDVLDSYLKQNMRFFVAKVNLEQQSKLGFNYLRPIQVAYESPKFMLPIRLGTVNADGAQELFIYTLTKKGRVETTNYRTVKLPTGMDLPVYVKNEFGDFYRTMFDQQVKKENMKTIFLEYAWDMNWCDPCAADPLSAKELRDLGVFWIEEDSMQNQPGSLQPRFPRPIPNSQVRDVFVTRLHVRYDAKRFPEDLVFQETADRTNFQGRYVLRHAWNGEADCDAAKQYRNSLVQRREQEAQGLSMLTGWDINKIRDRMGITKGNEAIREENKPWWQKLWLQ